MTTTIVTEKSNTVVAPTQSLGTIVEQTPASRVIVTGLMGPPGATNLNGLGDVDTTALSAGSVLVYNNQTQKWTATTLLEQQVFEAGQF